MKAGSLVRYWNMDDQPVLGLVTSDPFVNYELGDEERVNVVWFDDVTETDELVDTLLDLEQDYMQIISSV